jgi:hypothetical protein
MTQQLHFTTGFFLMWGGVFLFSLFIIKDFPMVIAFLFFLFTLFTHELAHVKECERQGVEVERIEFNCHGGAVHLKNHKITNQSYKIYLTGLTQSLEMTGYFFGMALLSYCLNISGLIRAFALLANVMVLTIAINMFLPTGDYQMAKKLKGVPT